MNNSLARLGAATLLITLAACHSEKPGQVSGSSDLVPLVPGTWVRSNEEGRADTLVYRHNTYRFPPRPTGRDGFRITPEGQFTRFDIAPGGGLVQHEGTWTDEGGNRLRIHLPDLQPAEPDYQLRLVDYMHGRLRLIKQAGN